MVTLERYERVGVIRLDNPPLNLMTRALTLALGGVLDEVVGERDVRAIVVTGAGPRAFSAGSDIREFPPLMQGGTVIDDKLGAENEVLDRLADLPMPTVAAIDAVALGGGAELALCCDRRVIAEDARIGFPEITLGTIPGSGGLLRLPRLIGGGRALALLWDGESITAESALGLGLVDEVVSSGKALERALERAQRWASRPPQATAAIKEVVREAERSPGPDAARLSLELSRDAFASEEMRAGVRRFMERKEQQERQ